MDPSSPNMDMPGDELEGCFWYTEEQIDDVISDMKGEDEVEEDGAGVEDALSLLDQLMGRLGGHKTRRAKRKVHAALLEENRKWKNPILYKFDGTHSTRPILNYSVH